MPSGYGMKKKATGGGKNKGFEKKYTREGRAQRDREVKMLRGLGLANFHISLQNLLVCLL